MASSVQGALVPDEILELLLALDPRLRRERYYGERAIFYNPGGAAPLGVILAAVKEGDGPNDRSSRLSRPGVYRFAFGITRTTFEARFGALPPRPPRGSVVDVPGHDPARLDVLMPHPVYAWMAWVQILSPSAASFDALRPLLAESLEHARARWARRTAAAEPPDGGGTGSDDPPSRPHAGAGRRRRRGTLVASEAGSRGPS